MDDYKIYTRFPVLYENSIIFSTNNTLYKFNRSTNEVSLLLTSPSEITHLKIYQDDLVFLTNFEEGFDIYHLNIKSNDIRRLTFKSENNLKPLYFYDKKLIFISTEDSPLNNICYELDININSITELPYQSVYGFSKNINTGDVFIQKDGYGYLSWKNYKGGCKAKIYKNEKLLIDLPGQCINPIYYKNRIYFIYEDNDNTNIYSCSENGDNLLKLTNHKHFKIQNLSLQKDELVYTQMGEIYIYNISQNFTKKIYVHLRIIKPKETQSLNTSFLTSIDNSNEKLICAVRGNIFEKKLYCGGLKQISSELRYVHTGFLDNKIFGFKDGRKTSFEIFEEKVVAQYQLPGQKIYEVVSSKKWVAYSNHKGELFIINSKGESINIALSHEPIKNMEWSYDGKFLVYELTKKNTIAIVIYSVNKKTNTYVVNDQYMNTCPSFDPENRFLVFLSNRLMIAQGEEIKFDYVIGIKQNVFCVPLKNNFNIYNYSENKDDNTKINEINLNNKSFIIIPIKEVQHKLKKIVAVEGVLIGLTYDNKVISFSLNSFAEEVLIDKVNEFIISNEKKSLISIEEEFIKIFGIKSVQNNFKEAKIFINNIKSQTLITDELTNIFDECTWFMEEFFWQKEKTLEFKEKTKVYKRFLNRINTNEELYEILKQIQAEMKTSHSYVFYDYPYCKKGYLGINVESINNKVIIKNFIKSSKSDVCHPILSCNQNIKVGDNIISINGERINLQKINEILLNKENALLTIKIETKDKKLKELNTKAIDHFTYKKWLYEEWVKKQENYINKKNPDIGYIHIRNMGKEGFIDFFTKYQNVYDKKAIIIDIRYNSGGHVSTLILEQLSKKQTGIDQPRHFPSTSIPNYSSKGNYVLIINQNTASDGEIFAKNFKEMNLGKIVGERTWGGIIGICPRYFLVNNLITTQPEFGTIFFNLDQEIENYGVIPDIIVQNNICTKTKPETDNQLNTAIELCFDFL